MAQVSLMTRIGKWSDHLTFLALRWRGAVDPSYQPTEPLLASIRRSQIDTTLALTPMMVQANIVCLFALIFMEVMDPRGQYFIYIWSSVLLAFLVNWISAYRIARTDRDFGRNRQAKAHSIGVLICSCLTFASVWSFGLIMALSRANVQETSFLGAMIAGMVAGGAWALYAIPLAAVAYGLILLVPAVVAYAVLGGPLWGFYILVSVSFAALVIAAVIRHSTQFIAERIGYEQAAAQRDVISLLMNDIEATGTCWLWRGDAKLRLSHVSDGFAVALGLQQSTILGRRLPEILMECGARGDDPKSQETFDLIASSEGAGLPNFEFRLTLTPPDGSERHLAFYGSRSDVGDAARAPFEGFVRDITDAVRDHEKIQFLATRDALTGLWNASGFISRAQEEIDKRLGRTCPRGLSATTTALPLPTASKGPRLTDPATPISMFLYIDADNLKAVNDTYGHRAGDVLLIKVGRSLIDVAGANCVVGRKGGDEFQLFGFFDSEAQARNIAQRLLQRLNADFQFDTISIRKSCSIGAVILSRGNHSIGTMEQWADRALYSAKNKGKARLEYYNEELGAEVFKQRRITADLPAFLERGELSVCYQPIVCVDTEAIVGCEALLRWTHPYFGPVSPAAIVEAARTTGKQAELGDYILRQALETVLEWPGSTYVSVNATAFELNDPDYYSRVIKAIDDIGCAPERVCIEITESQLLERNRTVLANLLRIRNCGIKVAVDDFGSGYSSLSYLPQYPSNFLKLDRSLLGHDNPGTGRAILRAVATLAHELKVMAVAEGVETEAELQMVRDAKISLVQGFHYHQPMSRSEIKVMMAAKGAGTFKMPY